MTESDLRYDPKSFKSDQFPILQTIAVIDAANDKIQMPIWQFSLKVFKPSKGDNFYSVICITAGCKFIS